ncbi:MAG: hypothetical protein JW738_04465, partial [Actinobacteria bacterium]|nr:hypothetical protein [Actinomycetota bacterium]
MNAEASTIQSHRRIRTSRFINGVTASFVGRSIYRIALVTGIIMGTFTAVSAISFVNTYNTVTARAALLATIGKNAGIHAMYGVPHVLDSAQGFTTWRTLVIMNVFLAMWAIAISTKKFRGEEAGGRLEMFQSGPTTPRLTAVGTLVGLGSGLLVIYIPIAAITVIVGLTDNIHFGLSGSMFYALACISGAAMFLSLGALASQVLPTRRSAAGLSAALFVSFFLMRAIGDSAPGLSWLT